MEGPKTQPVAQLGSCWSQDSNPNLSDSKTCYLSALANGPPTRLLGALDHSCPGTLVMIWKVPLPGTHPLDTRVGGDVQAQESTFFNNSRPLRTRSEGGAPSQQEGRG